MCIMFSDILSEHQENEGLQVALVTMFKHQTNCIASHHQLIELNQWSVIMLTITIKKKYLTLNIKNYVGWTRV